MDSEITIILTVGCYITFVEYRIWSLKRSVKANFETIDLLCHMAKRTLK